MGGRTPAYDLATEVEAYTGWREAIAITIAAVAFWQFMLRVSAGFLN